MFCPIVLSITLRPSGVKPVDEHTVPQRTKGRSPGGTGPSLWLRRLPAQFVPLVDALVIFASSVQIEPATSPPHADTVQSTELAEAGAHALSHPDKPE